MATLCAEDGEWCLVRHCAANDNVCERGFNLMVMLERYDVMLLCFGDDSDGLGGNDVVMLG